MGSTIIFPQQFEHIYGNDFPAYVVAKEIFIVNVVIHIDNCEFIL